MTDKRCTCGCGAPVTITEAQEPCGCGCDCCAPTPRSREQEIAELRRLPEATERRLAELGGGRLKTGRSHRRCVEAVTG